MYLKSIVLSGLCLFQLINGFVFSKQKYKRLRIMEPNHEYSKNNNCVLFFTGGSNAISPSIYSNFFENLNHKNISVYVPCFKYNHLDCLIRILDKKYKKVVLVGHSSGCTTLLKQIKNQSHIENIVLMDPVNTQFWGFKYFLAPFVKKILFIHAEKSYKINKDPYGWPFIPFLKITKELIKGPNISKIIEVTSTNHGHSDILNPTYSNIMHFTRITVGNKNRTKYELNQYHSQLSETILQFMEEEKIHYPTFPPQKR